MSKTLSSQAQKTLKSKLKRSPGDFQVKAWSKPGQSQSQMSKPKSTTKSKIKA